MYITDILKPKFTLPPWLTWITLMLFILGIVTVGLTIYNIDSLLSETKTDEAGSVAQPENPPWKDLKPFNGKTKTNGETGKKRRYYEWDHTHGDVEVYDRNRIHLGSMDPATGEMIKPPVKGRKLKRQ